MPPSSLNGVTIAERTRPKGRAESAVIAAIYRPAPAPPPCRPAAQVACCSVSTEGTDPGTAPGGKQLDLLLSALAVVVALAGLLIADRMYRRKAVTPPQDAALMPAGYRLLANKYYVDETYSFAIVKPLLALSKYLLEWVVDVAILGGIAWLLGGIAMLGGAILQRWQSGNLRSYAAWLALGAALLLVFVLAPYVFGASALTFFGSGH